MKYEAVISQNNHGYYIILRDIEKIGIEKNCDFNVADYLDIDLSYYHKCLVNNFNAWIFRIPNIGPKESYFNTKEDINKAIEWVNSLLVAAKLSD